MGQSSVWDGVRRCEIPGVVWTGGTETGEAILITDTFFTPTEMFNSTKPPVIPAMTCSDPPASRAERGNYAQTPPPRPPLPAENREEKTSLVQGAIFPMPGNCGILSDT